MHGRPCHRPIAATCSAWEQSAHHWTQLTERQHLHDMSGLLQGSGVSVTSDYKLNAEWKLNQQDLDRINSGVEPLLTGIAVPRWVHHSTACHLPGTRLADLQHI